MISNDPFVRILSFFRRKKEGGDLESFNYGIYKHIYH